MKIETAVREFKYGTMTLADPDPSQTPEEVKAFYAGIYPELNNAEIETERKGAKTVYEFRKAVGTKGNQRHRIDPEKEKAARRITDRLGLTDPLDPDRPPIIDSPIVSLKSKRKMLRNALTILRDLDAWLSGDILELQLYRARAESKRQEKKRGRGMKSK